MTEAAERILVLTATAGDSDALAGAIAQGGLHAERMADVESLCRALDEGAGCAVLAEEVLNGAALILFGDALRRQPSWSEFPVVVMSARQEPVSSTWDIVRGMSGAGQTTILERPVRTLTLLSAVQVALQSRRRQYQVRDHLSRLEQTERSLGESEERFRIAVENAPIAVFTQDRNLRYTWVAQRNLARAPRIRVGLDDEELLGPEQGGPLMSRKRTCLETGVGSRFEESVKNGAEASTWDVSVEPLRAPSGEVIGLTGVAVDITERKEAEAALARAEERLRAAVEASEIGVFEYDVASDTVDASERSWSIMSYQEGSMPRNLKAWVSGIHPEDRDRVRGAWERALTAGGDGVYEADFRILRGENDDRWVAARGRARFEETGDRRPVRLVGTVQDVTESKRAERRLQELTSDLEQLVTVRTEKLEHRTAQLRRLANQLMHAEQRERRRFAQLLHDQLQQILSAAKIHVDLIHSRNAGTELADQLATVQALLEESVDASRSLSVELSPPVLWNASLDRALRWQAQWMEAHHRLHTELDVDGSAPVLSEDIKVLLFEAMRELLFNVVKHAETDRCTVRLREQQGGQICLSVEDEGRGFDPERVGEQGGDSFGIFSIRERIEAVGGKLSVDSTPGRGARFHLFVPTRDSLEIATPVSTSSSARLSTASVSSDKIRLLVVDDHPIVRDGIVTMLRGRPDLEVVGEAADGEEAVELAELLRPHVIVMDVNMPRMNGLEATREITRRLPEIRVVVLSVQGEDHIATEMKDAGASAFLTKGGRSEILFETIRKLGREKLERQAF